MDLYFKTAIDTSEISEFLHFDVDKQKVVSIVGNHGEILIVCDKQNNRWMQRAGWIREARPEEINPPKIEAKKEAEKAEEIKPAAPKFRNDLPAAPAKTEAKEPEKKSSRHKSKPDSKPIKLF